MASDVQKIFPMVITFRSMQDGLNSSIFIERSLSAVSQTIAEAIAKTKAFTLAGGGDTIAAIQKYDIYDQVSYISTAGGAFLEFLEGKKLPAVEILEQRAQG